MASIKEATLHGIKWTALGNISNTIVGFILGIILARLLTPSDYGVVGMVAIFFSISGVFIDSGFTTALIQKKEVTEADKSTMFIFNVGMSVLFFVILFFAAPFISDFVRMPILKDILRIMATTIVIGAFANVQGSLLNRELNFRFLSIVSFSTYLSSGIIAVILAYKGWGPWSLVIQNVITRLVTTVIFWVHSKWKPKLIFSKKSFKSMFSFGSNLAINSLIDNIYDKGTGFLIGKFYSPAKLGYYTKGQGTASLPTDFITSIINKVFFPVMSKLQEDDDRLIHVYRKYMQILSLVIFFFMFMLIALGKPLIEFLYSSKWLPAVIFLQIWALSKMLSHVHSVNWDLLLVKSRTDLALKKEIVNKAIKFALIIAAIPISVEAICWAMVIGSVCDVFVNTFVTGKVISYGFLKQAHDFIPYLIKGAIFNIPAFTFTLTNWHPLIELIAGFITSTLLYITYLKITKDENYALIESLIPLRNNKK